MIINFNYIKLKNFMSFEEAEVTLGLNGYTIVSGENHNKDDNANSNGSGKSTLICESIIWALTGDTLRGTNDVARFGSDSPCEVEVGFTVDGDGYKVVRTKNPSNLFIYKNGENKSGKGIRDTTSILKEMLPDITPSLLGSVIIMGQGLPTKFSNNSPSGRKEVLEKLSKSDFMITDIKDRIGKRVSLLKSSLREKEDLVLSMDVELKGLKNSIEENESKLKNISDVNDIKAEKKALEESLLLLMDDKDKLDNDFVFISDDINNIMSQINDIKRDVGIEKTSIISRWEKIISNYESEHRDFISETNNKCQEEVNALKSSHMDCIISYRENEASLCSELSSLDSEIIKIESITDVCPTCGQKIPNVIKPDTSPLKERYAEVKGMIDDLRKEMSDISKSNEEEMQKITDKYASITSEKIAKFNEEIAKFKSSMNEELQSNISEKSSFINDLESELSITSKKKSEISNDLTKIESNISKVKSDISEKESLISTVEGMKMAINDMLEKSYKKIGELELQKEEAITKKEGIKTRLDIVNKMSNLTTRDFRGLLLQNIIEYIEMRSKEYSQIVFDTDKISFKLDGNNILIAYCGKAYENLSGGEQRRADLIIQFALRDMLCKYLNFSSNILVLDEIIDNLDSVGCQKVMDLISTKLNDVGSVYIISHHADIQMPVDHEIFILKDEVGISHGNNKF